MPFPAVQDYADLFLPLAKEGIPVICICITTKFSGSMQSALTARDMVLETFPGARITVKVDYLFHGLSSASGDAGRENFSFF